jgi:hypothetical protein
MLWIDNKRFKEIVSLKIQQHNYLDPNQCEHTCFISHIMESRRHTHFYSMHTNIRSGYLLEFVILNLYKQSWTIKCVQILNKLPLDATFFSNRKFARNYIRV